MEFVAIGGVAYLAYRWYNNTFIKPVEKVKEWIEDNVVEPIHEKTQELFEEVKEDTEKTDSFLGEMTRIGVEGEQARGESLVEAIKTGAKHVVPITREVPHAFEDGIETFKEETKDAPALAKVGVNDIKKGNIVLGTEKIAYSGEVGVKAGVHGIEEGGKDIGVKIVEGGKDVGHELKKGVEATKKQAKKTGNTLKHFFGFA